ncbi:MAG: phosphatidylglycerol:prolipoprotein diacylglycerol transferase [Phenylobacterium sp.]|jgi:phosphatidylglycerol:prolipoprotein diacylglycerol transferase
MVWDIDPIMISVAGLTIHWYGFLFAMAIMSGFQVMKFIYVKEGNPVEALDTLLIYAVVGIIVGARLGHCLFYDPAFYLSNPLKILAIWEGGLASHGGGLGAILAVYLYAKKHDVKLLWLLDRLGIATAMFGFFVRMANFVNSEIYGNPTTAPWGIVFKRIDDLARHPAQLYEAISYLASFFILALVYHKSQAKDKPGYLFGLFLCLIFVARIIVEFFKTKQAAYSNELILSTGQMLSIPFLLVGIALVIWSAKKAQ